MDWSYIAGFFDGEGHVALHQTKRGDKTHALSWFNTDRAVIDAMQTFMGAGHIVVRPAHGLGKKCQYILTVSRKADLLRVLDELIPRLLIKHQAAKALLKHLEEEVDEHRMDNFGKVSAIDDDQLKEWHFGEGRSVTEIAKMVGVHYSAVSQSFKLRGIKPNRKSLKGIPKSEETRRRMTVARRQRMTNAAMAI